jgi:uncharacterized membrane protein (DUF373 family)
MSSVVYGWEERGRYACSWCLFHEISVYHVLISIIVCVIMILCYGIFVIYMYELLLLYVVIIILNLFICRIYDLI